MTAAHLVYGPGDVPASGIVVVYAPAARHASVRLVDHADTVELRNRTPDGTLVVSPYTGSLIDPVEDDPPLLADAGVVVIDPGWPLPRKPLPSTTGTDTEGWGGRDVLLITGPATFEGFAVVAGHTERRDTGLVVSMYGDGPVGEVPVRDDDDHVLIDVTPRP